jgi:predicted outer membrane repeat protein
VHGTPIRTHIFVKTAKPAATVPTDCRSGITAGLGQFYGHTSVGASSGGGAAITCNGQNQTTQTIFVENTRFEMIVFNNSGFLQSKGSAMSILRFFTATIRNCSFVNNTGFFGGALSGSYVTRTVIEDCTFTGNKAQNRGGSIFFEYCSDVAILSSWFRNNEALLSPGFGGAILADRAYT